MNLNLVGDFNPFEQILVKMGIFPNFRGENKKWLKPPPSFPARNLSNYLPLLFLKKTFS